MGKQNEVENEQAAARTGSEVKRNEAVTRRTELQTAQDEAAFPGLMEKTKAEIARLEAAGQYEKARAIGEIYDNQPERLATMFGLKVSKIKADIAQSGAAAGASAASAANSYAHAARTRDEMQDPSKYRGVGNNAALTRSTFLPQLLNAASKQLADLENSDLTRAEKAQQRKELTAEINGYKAEMKTMGDEAATALKGGKGTPAPAFTFSSGSSVPAGSFAALASPSSSTTMPAAPTPQAAPALVREVDIQTSLKNNPSLSRQQVISSLKARGMAFAPDVK
jgi:cell division protein FtsB